MLLYDEDMTCDAKTLEKKRDGLDRKEGSSKCGGNVTKGISSCNL